MSALIQFSWPRTHRPSASRLLNAASLVFDIADHVLSGHFGRHRERGAHVAPEMDEG